MQLLTLELEDDYLLIGIHSTEEDYRLAYLINKYLNTKLIRFKDHLDFKDSNAEFPLFEYKDEQKLINYYLINNKYSQLTNNQKSKGLFDGNHSTISYLIPEKNKTCPRMCRPCTGPWMRATQRAPPTPGTPLGSSASHGKRSGLASSARGFRPPSDLPCRRRRRPGVTTPTVPCTGSRPTRT